MQGRVHCGFGRAVGVHITHAASAHACDVTRQRRLAACEHQAQALQRAVVQRLQKSWRHADQVDTQAPARFAVTNSILQVFARCNGQGGAAQQRAENLEHGHVKGRRDKLQQTVARADIQAGDLVGHHVAKGQVRDQHALGLTGGARGVDQVGAAFWIDG